MAPPVFGAFLEDIDAVDGVPVPLFQLVEWLLAGLPRAAHR